MISPDPLLFPTLSLPMQTLMRMAYGVLMLLTLMAALPHARRYFVSERWGGFTQSSPLRDVVQHPLSIVVIMAAWIAAAVALIAGQWVLIAASVNLACCYYFFNRLRWTSVSRGMGAPGFMALWMAAATWLLELTLRHAPDQRGLAVLALQVDFAAIMLSAGLYKLAAGYRQRQGMELGMVNPEWGYWPSFWKGWPSSHPLFTFFNEMAWGTEVVCGALMLFPPTRMLGGLGMFLSFIFIASQIRLGFLPELVMVSCLVFVAAGSPIDAAVSAWMGSATIEPGGALLPGALQSLLAFALWAYLALLPFVRAGMFYNQLQHRSLSPLLQRLLDGYANLFGLILWRVFTADVVNFFVRIWEAPSSGPRRLVSVFHRTGPFRFAQVAECIALTSVFTTLKYYPSNAALFEDRLLRYARTIPRGADSTLVFEWNKISPEAARFEYVPATEFIVDAGGTRVTERVLNALISVRAVPGVSPVHEGKQPGSYAPAQQ